MFFHSSAHSISRRLVLLLLIVSTHMPHLSATLAPADSLFEVILEYLGARLTVKNDFLTNIHYRNSFSYDQKNG